jgi:hypothetical protein
MFHAGQNTEHLEQQLGETPRCRLDPTTTYSASDGGSVEIMRRLN